MRARWILFTCAAILFAQEHADNLVSARVCILGTEPDEAAGGRVRFVLPPGDPCSCTEVGLGGHNAYAPPRKDQPIYIDTLPTDAEELHRLLGCVDVNLNEVSTETPQVISTTVYSDCQAARDAGYTSNGVYTIQHGQQIMKAYCDMDPSGKGYIVIQRRIDGSVNFNRSWEEYKHGFGDLEGEFWWGNEKLRNFTENDNIKWELLITLEAFDGNVSLSRFGDFLIRSDTFEVTADNYGDLGKDGRNKAEDAIINWSFSTYDRDNDDDDKINCAKLRGAGWWFKKCHNSKSNLNGMYSNVAEVEAYNGIQWDMWKGEFVSLKGCEMKARRIQQPVIPTTHDISGQYLDCQQALDGGHQTSGVYTIRHGQQNLSVYCDMETDIGQGFIVIQRRINGSVNFNQSWEEYKHGFGDLEGEFWWGNEKLRSFTENTDTWDLVIELEAFGGEVARALYKGFTISGDTYEFYYKDFAKLLGDPGNSLRDCKREAFTTRNQDNDNDLHDNCANVYGGGWWYHECDRCEGNLNGVYSNASTVAKYHGIQWKTWMGETVSHKACEMKIRISI